MNSLIGNYGGESEDEENQPPRKVQRSSVSPSSLPPSPSPSQNVAPEAVELDVYEKGEQAVYLSNQPCVIVAKHMDDYPNLYYTIQLVNEGKREKQTTAEKLSKRDNKEEEQAAVKLPEPSLPPSSSSSSSSSSSTLSPNTAFICIKSFYASREASWHLLNFILQISIFRR